MQYFHFDCYRGKTNENVYMEKTTKWKWMKQQNLYLINWFACKYVIQYFIYHYFYSMMWGGDCECGWIAWMRVEWWWFLFCGGNKDERVNWLV